MEIEEVTGFTGGTSGKETHLPMQETQETWIQPLSQEDPLEEEIATRFNISAWEIPWTKELGGLQSMGPQRVRYDWAHTCKEVTTFIFLKFTYLNWRLITILEWFCHTESATGVHASPSWPPSPLPPHPIPQGHPSAPALSAVSCIQPGLAICFTCDNTHVSMLFSHFITSKYF